LLEAAVGHLDGVLIGLAADDLERFTPHDHGEGETRSCLTLAVRAVARIQGKGIFVETVFNSAAEAHAALGEVHHGSPV